MEFELSKEKLRKTLVTENEREYQVFVNKQELIYEYDSVIKEELTLAKQIFISTCRKFRDELVKKISFEREKEITSGLRFLSLGDNRYKLQLIIIDNLKYDSLVLAKNGVYLKTRILSYYDIKSTVQELFGFENLNLENIDFINENDIFKYISQIEKNLNRMYINCNKNNYNKNENKLEITLKHEFQEFSHKFIPYSSITHFSLDYGPLHNFNLDIYLDYRLNIETIKGETIQISCDTIEIFSNLIEFI